MDMRAINPTVIEEYRRTGGRLGGELAELPVLLLTTVGGRTGRPHTTPLGYVEDAGCYVVAASAGGSPRHPDWYRNLVVEPTVTVEIDGATHVADARVALGADRSRLFARLAGALPGMEDYAVAVEREIPVVILAPRGASPELASAADELRALHRRGDPLVLVNAWDAATAALVAAAGARAVATSSAAIAASLGVPDDRSAPVDEMFAAIRRIAAAVDVPVTADLLDGYGLDAGELVDRLLAAGAVGCNLEDTDHARAGALLDPADVARTIARVRAAATQAGVPVVVNARIDAYLHHGPTATADVVARARRYLDAGADCVYPVRLVDPALTRHVVEALDAAVNANLAGSATVDALAAAGASRISVGPMAFHRALHAVDVMAADLLGAAVDS
jgi:deazaflavin-dependent oxidoreductase (nitroreductase family)